MKWDRWIGTHDQKPIYYNKALLSWNWNGERWTLRLHKFVHGDEPGQYHSRPAHAYRLVFRGGYIEQVFDEKRSMIRMAAPVVGLCRTRLHSSRRSPAQRARFLLALAPWTQGRGHRATWRRVAG